MKQQGANNTYLGNIREAVSSTITGLKLSFSHILQARKSRKPIGVENQEYFQQTTGIVTLQYPKQTIPVPDHGRYQLHNEIEDCIVCDKCAKICPVDCIEIEGIRAVEEIGKTSDGSSKRIYPAKFDIDMGKCCFCGLCTTVCPTECLTMTSNYDFSEFDVADHNFSFSEMTPLEILEKRQELDAFLVAKEKAKAGAAVANADVKPKAGPSTGFKPKIKARPVTQKTSEAEETKQQESNKQPFKPQIKARPVIPKKQPEAENKEEETNQEPPKAAYKPKIKARPVIPKKPPEAENKEEETNQEPPKAAYKPKIKARPVIPKRKAAEEQDDTESSETKESTNEPTAKKRAKPVIPPRKKKPSDDNPDQA